MIYVTAKIEFLKWAKDIFSAAEKLSFIEVKLFETHS